MKIKAWLFITIILSLGKLSLGADLEITLNLTDTPPKGRTGYINGLKKYKYNREEHNIIITIGRDEIPDVGLCFNILYFPFGSLDEGHYTLSYFCDFNDNQKKHIFNPSQIIYSQR